MKTVQGYNKIQGRNKIMGLEFFDLVILLAVYLVVFVISTNLIVNLMVVTASYIVLRFYKRGKAPHWSESVARFLLRPKYYSMKRESEKDVFEK